MNQRVTRVLMYMLMYEGDEVMQLALVAVVEVKQMHRL